MTGEQTIAPTFSTVRESTISMGIERYNLQLLEERVGHHMTYYALVNGHRIRPEPSERSNREKAQTWFIGLLNLYHVARIQNFAPRD